MSAIPPPGRSLHDRAILIVEDEYLLATELCAGLEAAGATIVGPAATLTAGLALADRAARLDGAILDVSLRGQQVFALADRLAQRRVPFVFATGYDAAIIPDRFHGVPRFGKPVQLSLLVAAMAGPVARAVGDAD